VYHSNLLSNLQTVINVWNILEGFHWNFHFYFPFHRSEQSNFIKYRRLLLC